MKNRLAAAALICVLIAGLLTTALTLHQDQAPPPPAAGTLVVPVDGLDPGTTPDHVIQVPRATVDATAPLLEDTDTRTEHPAGVSPEDLERARRAARAQNLPPLATAGATAGFQGCRTSFVRNQSSRRGVRPTEQTLHYTVSPNTPGWRDVDAVNALFDRTSSQASSNFIIDAEGHCAYIVPIEAKAWTQAAGNPYSVSYEIIATGREARYLAPAGLARLRSVIREVSRRTSIPMRRGHVNACTPTRSGIIQHKDWGLCGGGHVDITPFQIDDIVRQLVAGGSKPVTARDRVTCRKLTAWRRAGRPTGGTWERRSVHRKRALARRGATCPS